MSVLATVGERLFPREKLRQKFLERVRRRCVDTIVRAQRRSRFCYRYSAFQIDYLLGKLVAVSRAVAAIQPQE